jgi:hypothetical protein
VKAPPELSATPLPVKPQFSPPTVEPLALPMSAPTVPLPPLPAVPLAVHDAFQSSWANPLAAVVPDVVDQSDPLLEPLDEPDELLDHAPDADALKVPVAVYAALSCPVV